MASKPKIVLAPSADEGNTPVERQPVMARGDELLKLIYNSGGLYLTQDEGAEIVASGDAKVNTDDTQGDAALVLLTPQGASKVAPSDLGRAKPVYDIDDYVPPPPAKKNRGGKRGSKYPFDKLEVNKSFHVPVSKDMPNPVSALASSLTGARRKYEVAVLDDKGQPVMETVKVKTYAVDAKGKRVKNREGKFVVTGETTGQKPKMEQTRDFYVVEAAKDDPKGPGARVVRSK